jgi:hypothetical protein
MSHFKGGEILTTHYHQKPKKLDFSWKFYLLESMLGMTGKKQKQSSLLSSSFWYNQRKKTDFHETIIRQLKKYIVGMGCVKA